MPAAGGPGRHRAQRNVIVTGAPAQSPGLGKGHTRRLELAGRLVGLRQGDGGERTRVQVVSGRSARARRACSMAPCGSPSKRAYMDLTAAAVASRCSCSAPSSPIASSASASREYTPFDRPASISVAAYHTNSSGRLRIASSGNARSQPSKVTTSPRYQV